MSSFYTFGMPSLTPHVLILAEQPDFWDFVLPDLPEIQDRFEVKTFFFLRNTMF